jgi:hypothetical protein
MPETIRPVIPREVRRPHAALPSAICAYATAGVDSETRPAGRLSR